MQGIYLTTILALAISHSGTAQVDFDTEVVPLLTKAGCNSGACHGAAAGRGDFRLSLFGSRPEQDYEAIARELGGRRANLVVPEQSLLLAKPTEMLPHEGGLKIQPDSWQSERLLTWLKQGAPRGLSRELVELTLETRSSDVGGDVRLTEVPAQFPLVVWGTFRDLATGELHRENVTPLVVVTSHDPESLRYEEPDPQDERSRGTWQVLRGGRHAVTLRYLDQLETLTVTAPLHSEPLTPPRKESLSESSRGEEADKEGGEGATEAVPPLMVSDHWIDQEIVATLRQLRLPASDRADDSQLLRRLTLHLTGRLPTMDEIATYEKEDPETRYEQRVDQLLASAEAEEYWTWYITRLLRLRAPGGDQPALDAIHDWLREQWRQEAGWDQTLSDLLLAEGDSHESGPATFHRQSGDARTQAEFVSETLWGVRLRCANCHDHPLDRWTQDDYHGLAAIFARLDRGRIVRGKSSGDVVHPATGEPAPPRLPGDRNLTEEEREQGRAELVQWMRNSDSPLFARAMVNRLWKSLMGRGLIEPTDDLRDTNPPTHPRLLARLESEFEAGGFRIRPLLRTILLSETYRLGNPTSANQHDDRYHSHRQPTRLAPEVLADAIADVTGIWDQYGELPRGTRAIALRDPRAPAESLDRLGRCGPGESCDPHQPPATQGVSTRLHLLNGPLLNEKIASPEGDLHQTLRDLGVVTATFSSSKSASPDGDSPPPEKSLADGTSLPSPSVASPSELSPTVSSPSSEQFEELIRVFYIRALGRSPRGVEREFWLEQFQAASNGEVAAVAEDFLWSLLNCQEFVTNH
jgi:hypothetical protein